MKRVEMKTMSLAVVALLTACNQEDPCGVDDFTAQATSRFPVGETYLLPPMRGDVETCGERVWELVESAGENLLASDADSQVRFTPDAAGSYSFALTGTDIERELVAISADEIPFHNLMYLPTASMAEVGEEVWVAQAYAPKVSRLDKNGEELGAVSVGPWPVALAVNPEATEVYVVQQGNDRLGVVDVASGRLVDSIWVGDEPSNVVLSPDGTLAYVALSGESAVAVVDLESRLVEKRLASPEEPRALALSADGGVLYVAGHRTGQPQRYPYAVDEMVGPDVMGLDVLSGDEVFRIEDVGNIVHELVLDASDERLVVSTTASWPELGSVAVTIPFEAQIQAYDTTSGMLLNSTILQPGSEEEGYPLGPQDIILDGESIWVVIEGTELLIELNAEDLSERGRVAVAGAPRTALSVDGDVWVHASQAFEIAVIQDGELAVRFPAGIDPRPAEIAAGQLTYTQPGDGYGENYSCNSCHYEGRGDMRVWKAGPFETWELSRPLLWLEGTEDIGWGGYVSEARTFGYTGLASIINKWTTTEVSENLSAFLKSLMPPPKANAYTQPDGGLSPEALLGQVVYQEAGCEACHGLPVGTNNVTMLEGATHHRSSTPSLVGSYRHGAWLKDGSASNLRDAVVAMLDWTNVSGLEASEVDALTRYLSELTDRDFFLLKSLPDSRRMYVGSEESLELIFNQPVYDSVENRAKVQLLDASDALVESNVVVEGRSVWVEPLSALAQDASYHIHVEAGFEAWDERKLDAPLVVDLQTAPAPELNMDGYYKLVVYMPMIDMEAGGFDRETIVEITNPFVAAPTTDGSQLSFTLNTDLEYDTQAVFAGKKFEIPAMPVFLGRSLAQASAIEGTALDLDADNIMDVALGSFRITGPGIWEEDIRWEIQKTVAPGTCVLGSEGDVMVQVSTPEGEAPLIDFGETPVLGFFVTSYGATLPLGPGQAVTNGDAYWVLSTADFPNGFSGPVRYGEVPEGAEDLSEENGAELGGAVLEEGGCYQFSVITTDFETGSWTIEY